MDPMSLHDVEQKLAEYADALVELIDEHEKLTDELARAEAAYERKFHAKRAELYLSGEKMRVDAIESIARHHAADEYDALVLVRYRESFARHAMHSLRQVLSAFQTRGKFVADEAGHGRYGRR